MKEFECNLNLEIANRDDISLKCASDTEDAATSKG